MSRAHAYTAPPPGAAQLFNEQERAALLPLPAEPFTAVRDQAGEGAPGLPRDPRRQFLLRAVSLHWRTLEAYMSERVVEIYQGTTLVATHVRCTQPGQWRTRLDDYPPDKAQYLMRTPAYCRQIAAKIGPATVHVVETLLSERPWTACAPSRAS